MYTASDMTLNIFLSVTQPSPTPVTVLVQQQVSDTVPSHSHVSKTNDVEASHMEAGEKEDDEMEENKDQEETENDKEDDNGDDDSQSVDEV